MMFNPWTPNPCRKCIISMVCTKECPDKLNYWCTVIQIRDGLPVVLFGLIFLIYIGGYVISYLIS